MGHRPFHQVRRSEYLRVVIRAVSRSGGRSDSIRRSRSGLAVTLRYARWLRLTHELRRSVRFPGTCPGRSCPRITITLARSGGGEGSRVVMWSAGWGRTGTSRRPPGAASLPAMFRWPRARRGVAGAVAGSVVGGGEPAGFRSAPEDRCAPSTPGRSWSFAGTWHGCPPLSRPRQIQWSARMWIPWRVLRLVVSGTTQSWPHPRPRSEERS